MSGVFSGFCIVYGWLKYPSPETGNGILAFLAAIHPAWSTAGFVLTTTLFVFLFGRKAGPRRHAILAFLTLGGAAFGIIAGLIVYL